MDDTMTVAEVCAELGVSRSWVYAHIDPEARRRDRRLDGANREQGRPVRYPRELVGGIVADSMRASGFWRMHDFAANAPDPQALAKIHKDGMWSASDRAYEALRAAVAPEERRMLDAAMTHGPRCRARPSEVPVPEGLLAEVRSGDFGSLLGFEGVRRAAGLVGMSDEMVYRSIYEENMLRVSVFGRVWYVEAREPAAGAGPHVRLKVPLSAFPR